LSDQLTEVCTAVSDIWPVNFVRMSGVSAVTNEGEEGCEGGRCAARLLPSIKVRVHTYAWAGPLLPLYGI